MFIQYLLFAKHCFSCFSRIITFNQQLQQDKKKGVNQIVKIVLSSGEKDKGERWWGHT
jgi:hypothetical protein